MTEKDKNDILYVCSMVECVARKTKNHRRDVVSALGKSGIEHQLRAAEVNHSLSFDQVSDEWIADYKIGTGNFDTTTACRYALPSETEIGSVYQRLVLAIPDEGSAAQRVMNVFSSFISDEISNFNSSLYYTNPDYIKCSYEADRLLA